MYRRETKVYPRYLGCSSDNKCLYPNLYVRKAALRKEALESLPQPYSTRLTLPYGEHAPAEGSQFAFHVFIVLCVPRELRYPVSLISIRDAAELAGMLMPKAPMHEDYGLSSGKSDIRRAR